VASPVVQRITKAGRRKEETWNKDTSGSFFKC
jgi:hypothetical protein